MIQAATDTVHREAHAHSEGGVVRFIVIALTAFLTVVDLFATQAILADQALQGLPLGDGIRRQC